MKKNNIISDWLDQYGNPEIDKFVETQLNQNKMTAVEYYESLMKVFDRWLEKKEISIDQYNSEKDKLIKQVKAIEKKQIMDAFANGEHQQGFEGEAEQYYNETFKSE